MPLTPELKKLLEEKGIVGVSNEIGVVRVYVETREDAEKLLLEIPEIQVAGISYKVEPIISGRFFTLQALDLLERTSRVRPILGGISCANRYITAGTLTAIFRDKTTKELKILSNNHVLTRIIKGIEGEIGDEILQPSPYDDGTLSDVIGKLEKFVSIKLPPETNVIDAAIATCEVDSKPYEVMDIGTLGTITQALPNMVVKKSGRTTGLTRGMIFDTSATVKVYGYYSPDTYAIFEDQIVISPAIAAGGDSGSILCTEDNRIVGLIFAGSDRFTLANKFSYVSEMLNLEVIEKPIAKAGLSLLLLLPLAFVFIKRKS
ncbi:MAG: hypothetical protein QXK24_07905 [Ignisphaera sp.]